jgi:hypothetical protein
MAMKKYLISIMLFTNSIYACNLNLNNDNKCIINDIKQIFIEDELLELEGNKITLTYQALLLVYQYLNSIYPDDKYLNTLQKSDQILYNFLPLDSLEKEYLTTYEVQKQLKSHRHALNIYKSRLKELNTKYSEDMLYFYHNIANQMLSLYGMNLTNIKLDDVITSRDKFQYQLWQILLGYYAYELLQNKLVMMNDNVVQNKLEYNNISIDDFSCIKQNNNLYIVINLSTYYPGMNQAVIKFSSDRQIFDPILFENIQFKSEANSDKLVDLIFLAAPDLQWNNVKMITKQQYNQISSGFIGDVINDQTITTTLCYDQPCYVSERRTFEVTQDGKAKIMKIEFTIPREYYNINTNTDYTTFVFKY